MKSVIFVTALIFLGACGAGSSGGPSPALTGPSAGQPDQWAPEAPSGGQTALPAPASLQQPAQDAQLAPAAIGPATLTCSGLGPVNCTGGALGASTVAVNLAKMFISNDSRFAVVSAQVTAQDVRTTRFGACPANNMSTCYDHSVCIQATIRDPESNFYTAQFCGDSLDSSGVLVAE